ncbi:septum formation initiator family protein [Mycolicibacterium sp. P1-5]|uniref:FtsB family cell division protein n=1 Tax=Mycolicibacterium sp. P1-5 TaxID=2024617 RepID=UPI0011EDC29E|nr:septum formation initiator family protein [Mycolicibacterium sp. P1-5]KAA0105131.1 septum formation initiator family protein [Mycolicibacterium sp. P1-5]
MAESKRPDSKRRTPASRPGVSGRVRSRTSPAAKREARPTEGKAKPEAVGAAGPATTGRGHSVTEPVRRAIAASVEQQSEQRLGFTARRAAILAAVVCVLTLTIAGPVRTYFAQRTEMKQLAASEAAMRKQIADLESQKAKLGDPVYIAAQARERLGFVMPGDIPYQVQLPAGAVVAPDTGPQAAPVRSNDPWYTSLWHTIADTPHGPPPVPAADPGLPPPEPAPVPPPAPGG